MTIYISLPISGYDLSERRALAEGARRHLLSKWPKAQVVSPFDISDRVDAMNPKAGYSDYMKEDLAFIIDKADMVFFLVNPRLTGSKGVKLEYQAARIYGKRIMRLAVKMTKVL